MADKISGVLSSATAVLTRAVEFDQGGRFSEAVVCYQEGLALLMEVLKSKKCFFKLWLMILLIKKIL